ncbi:MAG TPA: HNH endonuclease [Bacteroidales bacterium]|nr:HNH endonuclease [Bacteroidales bacterium]
MACPHHPGRKSWIKKGTVPPNKGKKQIEYMTPEAIERTKATRFKKGQRVWNHKPVGYERVNTSGYTEVKTAEPNKFELKHRVIWRQHYGKIPRGHNVQFRDGNPQNFNIENLYLISRSEQLSKENSIHARYPKDVQLAIQMKGALNRYINKIKNNNDSAV